MGNILLKWHRTRAHMWSYSNRSGRNRFQGCSPWMPASRGKDRDIFPETANKDFSLPSMPIDTEGV